MRTTPAHIPLLVALCLFPLFNAGCDRNPSGNSSPSRWTPTKDNVSGFYASDVGMVGWGGSVKLAYGTFILKDPFLDKNVIGDYSVDGSTVTFYSDGMKIFQATAYQDRLVVKGKGTTYQKK